MPTKLDEKAIEGGTYGIEVKFWEKATPTSNPVPFTPNSGLKWSLHDRHGNPINGKEDQDLTSAEIVTIVLSGADLALAGGPSHRYVTVEGTYNGVLGDNLNLVDEVSFQISNLVGKP